MGQRLRLAVAAITVAAMTLGVAAPAGAQEEPEALGFAVDKTQAQPGALVLGKVDTDDVAEHCTTTVEEFQQVILERTELMLEVFYGEPEVQDEISTDEDVVTTLLALIALGILFDDDTAADALAQTFVMTFADIATQAPVGERSNFDPAVGEASVVVPDIEPGLWAVAGTCVSPSTDEGTIRAAVSEGAAFLAEEFGLPETFPATEPDEFIFDFFDVANLNELAEVLTPIAPTLLEPWMVPDAFGAVVFCILDAEGNCPDGEVEPPPGEQIEPKPSEEPAPAQAVVVAPTFTG